MGSLWALKQGDEAPLDALSCSSLPLGIYNPRRPLSSPDLPLSFAPGLCLKLRRDANHGRAIQEMPDEQGAVLSPKEEGIDPSGTEIVKEGWTLH